MSYMEQQMQSVYDSYNHLEEQNYYEELADENTLLKKALRDTLSKIGDSHPELILKYAELIGKESKDGL